MAYQKLSTKRATIGLCNNIGVINWKTSVVMKIEFSLLPMNYCMLL